MSSDHYKIAIHQSQWDGSSSIEENGISGFSDPLCQNGTILINVPSDISS